MMIHVYTNHISKPSKLTFRFRTAPCSFCSQVHGKTILSNYLICVSPQSRRDKIVARNKTQHCEPTKSFQLSSAELDARKSRDAAD